MLHSESPKGTLLRKKIEEFNSTTTGLIMTMVGTNNIHLLLNQNNDLSLVNK